MVLETEVDSVDEVEIPLELVVSLGVLSGLSEELPKIIKTFWANTEPLNEELRARITLEFAAIAMRSVTGV